MDDLRVLMVINELQKVQLEKLQYCSTVYMHHSSHLNNTHSTNNNHFGRGSKNPSGLLYAPFDKFINETIATFEEHMGKAFKISIGLKHPLFEEYDINLCCVKSLKNIIGPRTYSMSDDCPAKDVPASPTHFATN